MLPSFPSTRQVYISVPSVFILQEETKLTLHCQEETQLTLHCQEETQLTGRHKDTIYRL